MWTIAAINKKFNGPLGSYNGLNDVHLAHYFSRPSRQSHLKAVKLITEDGFIIPEKNVKGALYIDEKKKKFYDILARSILQNAIHKEGTWNKKLCNYLEDISKMTAVDKARKTFKKKTSRVAPELSFELHELPNHSSEGKNTKFTKWPSTHREILNPPYSAPTTGFSLVNDGHHKIANLKRCLSAKEHSPYVVPLLLSGSYKDQSYSVLDIDETSKKGKRKKHTVSSRISKPVEKKISPNVKSINIHVLQQNLKFSKCKITLFYHGHLHLSNFERNLTKNILIKQQHCGGTPVVIFKGKISTNGVVSFFSLDHQGFFFSITVFLNGIRELKLSSCCVFRYLPGRRFGGQNGTFSIRKIEGGTPCLKCQYQNLENKSIKSFIHASDSSVDNSDGKENSALVLKAAISKTTDKSLNDIFAAEDNTHATVEDFDMNETEVVDEAKSEDEDIDDIEEILDDLHNDAKNDSSSEEHVVDITNASSIEDDIKDQEGSDHSDSQQNISEVSDIYQQSKNTHEISVDSSSSEDERENQHIVTVSVHGSPVRS